MTQSCSPLAAYDCLESTKADLLCVDSDDLLLSTELLVACVFESTVLLLVDIISFSAGKITEHN